MLNLVGVLDGWLASLLKRYWMLLQSTKHSSSTPLRQSPPDHSTCDLEKCARLQEACDKLEAALEGFTVSSEGVPTRVHSSGTGCVA